MSVAMAIECPRISGGTHVKKVLFTGVTVQSIRNSQQNISTKNAEMTSMNTEMKAKGRASNENKTDNEIPTYLGSSRRVLMR